MRSLCHAGFWIGELIGDLVLGFDRGDHAVHLPEYFAILADLVLESRKSDLLCIVSWRGLTNKMIYLNHAEKFPVPKVDFVAGVAYRDAWRRLTSPVLTSVARDTLFLLLHNKLPINERLFRIGLDSLTLSSVQGVSFVMWNISSVPVLGSIRFGVG